MWKRLKSYIEYLASLDPAAMSADEKQAVRTEALVRIGFFQHERLIHLLVTLAFAVFIFLSGLAYVLAPSIGWLLLLAALLALEFPYIIHYFHLENGVQRLYELYDRFES